ncbi:hypothetical protein TNCT_338481 [Trichonephila clavata]|uniref:Uncharacterized protein n=1 Tax=Trichonephila clavata TaxID=2740835 RepID=A0A8X6F4J4_TRICU|nr:hypothetical protein TNCT_338481 [Trichonephila clavata]
MKLYYDPDLQTHFNDSVASDDRRFGESIPSTGRNDYAGPTTRSRSKTLKPSRCFFTLLERRSRIFHYAIKEPRARQDGQFLVL